MPAKRSPYGVKKHCRLQRVQTEVYVKCRGVYTLFSVDYQFIRCKSAECRHVVGWGVPYFVCE